VKKKLAVILLTALCATGLAVTALAQSQTSNPNQPFTQNEYPRYWNGTQNSGLNLLQQQNYSVDFYQSTNEADKLARQLAKAKGDGEKESITAKLREALEKQFDQRQKKHQAEAEMLEAQVKKLKELISSRNENRKEIISRRLDQVVREAQGLGW
jgi:hypothetical protein